MENNNSDFRNYLLQIIENKPSSLYKEVAEEALEYHTPESFFEDLQSYGCISGMVGKLIYYIDTHKFYDNYYDKIEDLRYEYEQSTGLSVLEYVNGDLKNWLSWFAFEEIAKKIFISLKVLDLLFSLLPQILLRRILAKKRLGLSELS